MTSEHPILGQVALGYSPMIDRNRAVIATRLTVFPARPDAALDAAALLAAVNEVWPDGGGNVSLNVSSETLLNDLLKAEPSTNLMIEVPAFLAGEADNVRSAAAIEGARQHAADQGPAVEAAAARGAAVLPLVDHRPRRRPPRR